MASSNLYPLQLPNTDEPPRHTPRVDVLVMLLIPLMLRELCQRFKQNPLLSYMLQNYHDTYVEISPVSMSKAQAVVHDIKPEILQYFQSAHPEYGIKSLDDTGSYREGLEVVASDEYDVIIPLSLENMPWRLLPSPDTPGYVFVHRDTVCEVLTLRWFILLLICYYFNHLLLLLFVVYSHDVIYRFRQALICDVSYLLGFSIPPYDKYLVNGYLCPQTLMGDFQGSVQKAVNKISKYKVSVGRHGPAITLRVLYGRRHQHRLDIDLVPTLEIGNTSLVAKPYLNVHRPEDALLWRQSYSDKEHKLLASAPKNYHQILKIAKAIRLNSTPFGMYSSYVYKMIVMHMIAEKTLHHQRKSLDEGFVTFLEECQVFLTQKKLPHIFNSEVNLLEERPPQVCDNLRRCIKNLLNGGKYQKLLKKRKYIGRK